MPPSTQCAKSRDWPPARPFLDCQDALSGLLEFPIGLLSGHDESMVHDLVNIHRKPIPVTRLNPVSIVRFERLEDVATAYDSQEIVIRGQRPANGENHDS